MAKTVDARGLACPQPVIQTRKAMQQADQIVTLVDNETAVTNVSRMASKAGWRVEVKQLGEEFQIEMLQQSAAIQEPVSEPETPPAGAIGASDSSLVLVISSETMGHGDKVLGDILMRGFLHTIGEIDAKPQTIILFNSGVKLACEGSAMVEDLRELEEAGVQILACGTCLNHFELQSKLGAGQVSNMYDIAETMLGAGRVVNL